LYQCTTERQVTYYALSIKDHYDVGSNPNDCKDVMTSEMYVTA